MITKKQLLETGFKFAEAPEGPLRKWILGRKEAGKLQIQYTHPVGNWTPASSNSEDICRAAWYRCSPGTEVPAELAGMLNPDSEPVLPGTPVTLEDLARGLAPSQISPGPLLDMLSQLQGFRFGELSAKTRTELAALCAPTPPPQIGEKVVRGPDWHWGDQDGTPGAVGTIVACAPEDNRWNVQVQWPGKDMKYSYALGASNKFDVVRVRPQPQEETKSGTTPGKEETMTTSPLKIETKTYASGIDVALMSNDQIAGTIKAQKADIAELAALNEEPIARIAQEIEQREAGLKAFIAAVQSLPKR